MIRVFTLIFLGLLGIADAQAQYWYRGAPAPVVNPWDLGEENMDAGVKFTFARIRYDSYRTFRWRTDYPESDLNFSLRLSELTTIDVNRDENGQIIHVVLDMDDDRIFDYPYIYMVEVGYLDLSDYQASRLREYFDRGGLLHVDDFWGEMEWANWEEQIRKVFPDEERFPIVDVPLDHPIFHAVFDLDHVPQVPSLWAFQRHGMSSDRLGLEAYCRGIFGDDGRLMVVMTFNTDLGDGWEREGENFEYFKKFSVAGAYPLGINIVVYALTH